MPLEIRVGGRQTGRTKWLIQLCHEAEKRGEVSYIVCMSHSEAYRISQLAQELNTPIPFPLTYEEFITRSYHGQNIRNLLVDNIEMLIQYIAIAPVTAMTVTKENEDVPEYLRP